ncbi:MAG: histidine kinase, partial [Bacteroidota bacterium]
AFQVYDIAQNRFYKLGVAEGLLDEKVDDFEVVGQELWLLSRNQLLKLDLRKFPKAEAPPKLYLDSARVGATLLSKGEALETDYAHNDLHLYLSFRNIPQKSSARIEYRILGLNDEWISIPATQRQIQRSGLAPGNYQVEARARYGTQFSPRISLRFLIRAPFWQRTWFFLLILVSALLLVSIFFRWLYKRNQKRNLEKLKQQRLETDLLETQLKALRSQMNPHFIFNSLSAIQNLILKQETEASYDYMVMFADLVRSTLNYSEREFIPIRDELNFLEVYLSLEKLRFGEEFEFEINYAGPEEIEVASLVIQPFIENSLLHGLLHKEGQKKLSVNFELGEQLICTVTDNGVGRAKASRLKANPDHQSFASGAIQKRMDILSERYKMDLGFEIEDLFEGEMAVGTRVRVRMPFQQTI